MPHQLICRVVSVSGCGRARVRIHIQTLGLQHHHPTIPLLHPPTRSHKSCPFIQKPPPLAFNKDILHWPVCSQSSLAAGPLVKFSASGVGWGGVGQRTEYCDSDKNGGYSNLRLNSQPQGAAFWARRELWRGAWSVLFQLDKNVICHWKWEPGQAMSHHDWWRQNSAIIKSWSRVRPIKNKPTAAHNSGQNLRLWPLADFTIQV